MGRRPVCLVCLLLMGMIFLLDLAGFPLARGNPLPASVQQEIRLHPEATVVGEAVRCKDTENSCSVYLKQVCILKNSEKIPIQNLRVFLEEKTPVPAGACLVLSGKLEEVGERRNPGEFDRRQYYRTQRISYFMKEARIEKISSFHSRAGQFLVTVRERLTGIIEDGAGDDAALFEAMLLGEKENLETETKLKYQAAGILHILAISGLHISMIGMGIYRLLNLAGAGVPLSGFLALLVMVPYGALTGESVSAMRAICMFLLAVGARLMGRTYDRMTALALAAILLLLESPAYLYSSSFLMSFAAVAGIGIVSPQLCRLLEVKHRSVEAMIASLSVQLTMLPVLLAFYGEVSLAGLILNLVILPTVGIILVSGIGGVVCGTVSRAAGIMVKGSTSAGAEIISRLFFLPGRFLLHFYDLLCGWGLQLPFCTWIPGCPKGWRIIGYYMILSGCLLSGHFLKKISVSDKRFCPGNVKISEGAQRTAGRGILLGILFLNCLLLGWRSSHQLEITCLDVGQGDGIVVETPDRGCFLIDGGSSGRSGLGTYVLLPFLKHQGISRIDAVFVSHTDEDHISGILELLELMEKNLAGVRVKLLVMPDWKVRSGNYEKLLRLAERNQIRVAYVKKGDEMKMGDLSVRVLAPAEGTTGEDTNEGAQVLELAYKNFRGLFTGDIGTETEKELMPYVSDVDFLKVAHHGSKYSTSREFLEKTKPEIAVISCSSTNRYGHPAPETVKRLQEAGANVEYTMESGAVCVITDGKNVRVKEFVPKDSVVAENFRDML